MKLRLGSDTVVDGCFDSSHDDSWTRSEQPLKPDAWHTTSVINVREFLWCYRETDFYETTEMQHWKMYGEGLL